MWSESFRRKDFYVSPGILSAQRALNVRHVTNHSPYLGRNSEALKNDNMAFKTELSNASLVTYQLIVKR